VVVVNGGELTARAVGAVADDATIIAADGGLDRALAAHLQPHRLVGDLDSISADGRAWATAHEVVVDAYDTDKDATDTELALALAAESRPTDLLVLAGIGDRLDHTLGTIVSLGAPTLRDLASVRMIWGDSLVQTAHSGRPVTLHATDGATFSVIALHGTCDGVSIAGARWPLNDATIQPATSRGLSNEFIDESVLISVGGGVLTVVQS
jgi:thiamine pyrophosphokinase